MVKALAGLFELPAWEAARHIRGGELLAEEYVSCFLERMEKLDGRVKAYITVVREEALKQARLVDEKVKAGARLGRLAGVPVAVKDNICTSGIRTTCASRMLENFVPPYDATVVERLKAEDAVILGKTNMDEFAMGTSTETSYFGPTKNPWNLERVPGGSSGGSAAAVAAGMAPLSLGSDTGGSIRCPASFCGVVGLKPTYGLVSRYGLIAYANSLEQIGPIAFNTRDCSLLLSVIAGRDLRDSTTLSVEAGSYDGALGGDLKGFKVGLVKELMGEGTHPAVVEALQRFAGKLEELGAWIGKVSLPILEYALPAYYIIAMSEASSNLARYDGIRYGFRAEGEGLDWSREFSVTRSLGFGSEVKRRIILGTYALSAGYYDRFFLKAVKVATMIRRSLTESFKKFSLLLAPTMPLPPFRLGEKISDPLALYMCDIDTVPVNLAGVPAISVPCGFHEGLPLGAQLIAPPLGEGRLLKAAEAYEKAAPEMFKRPPLR